MPTESVTVGEDCEARVLTLGSDVKPGGRPDHRGAILALTIASGPLDAMVTLDPTEARRLGGLLLAAADEEESG